jgi:hypothetical protein
MNKFLPIHLTEESINLVIAALRKLPHDQVHDLVMDIATQRDQALAEAKTQAQDAMPEVDVVE